MVFFYKENNNCFYLFSENFPEPEKVKLINRLYDYGIENNRIAHDARVCIDYMWPTYWADIVVK